MFPPSLFIFTAYIYALVSLPCIEAVWEAFNDLADGFGVSSYEFRQIMAELMQELGLTRGKIDEKANALFSLLDEDKVRIINEKGGLGGP